ncbi:MAG: sodium:solute symporter family protein [Planctomycetota bacterium]|jgi:Na+/proline symporter
MSFLGLHIADVFVLGLYLVGITCIGVWAAKKIKNIADFFMPRRFGKAMMIMHAFGTGTHSDQAVSVASKSYTNGLSGIWYQWLWLFATPFYWLIAPVMRRFRAITTADVFEARFSPSVAKLFAVVGMLNLSINIGIMLKGSSAVIDAGTGGSVDANVAIAVMTVMFVIYGIAGGLSAAIITDFIQGVLTVIFSFLLLPFVLVSVRGLGGIRDIIGPNAKEMFSLVAPGEIGFFYVIMISVNGLVGIVTQPHTMGNCAAGKTENEGRIGWMCGNFVKRVCTVAWCLTGLAAVAYFKGRGVQPDHADHVFGIIAADFLPKILPGLLGLFLAALLASVMSSCDSFMIASSGLFTKNIYQPLIPDKTQKHYVLVARITSLVIVAGGVAFAYWLPGVVKGLEIFWKVSAMMGIAFWLGLFWRRTTVAGAWAGTLAGFGVLLFTSRIAFGDFVLWDFHANFADKLPDFMVFEGKLYMPWQMVFYLSTGFLLTVIVSLLTKPVDREKLDNFYALVRTPIKPGEQVAVPCTLPSDAVVPEKRSLFPNTGLEILIPSRSSVLGFLVGWGCVAAIIYSVYLIANA